MQEKRGIESTEVAGPVQIVSITDDHKFVLDEEKLKKILKHPRVQDKRVKKNRTSSVRKFFLSS